MAATDAVPREGASTALVLAYFHLRTLELDRVDDWLEVAEGPEARPDLHVLRAWRILRGERPVLAAAQEHLIAAGSGGGLPVFTEGLRLLIDGLELLGSAEDIVTFQGFRSALEGHAPGVGWRNGTGGSPLCVAFDRIRRRQGPL
jgi:hypothetical protein